MSSRTASLTLATSVVALTLFATACAGTTTSPEEESAQPPGDPTAAMSAEGLTVDEATADHAAGRFARNGAAIRFDFTKSSDTRSAHITRDSGEPVLDTTLANGVDISHYFGGRATATGTVGGEITEKTGDTRAFEELSTSPEMNLVPELKAALLASHRVDEALFRAPSAARAGADLAPQAINDGVWRRVNRSSSYGFFSWSFWGTTSVLVGDYLDWWGGSYQASFQAGAASKEYLSGSGHDLYGRNWWGAYVTVAVDDRSVRLCGITDSLCNYRDWLWVYAY